MLEATIDGTHKFPRRRKYTHAYGNIRLLGKVRGTSSYSSIDSRQKPDSLPADTKYSTRISFPIAHAILVSDCAG